MSTTLPYNSGRLNLIAKGVFGCCPGLGLPARPQHYLTTGIGPGIIQRLRMLPGPGISHENKQTSLKSLFRLKFARHWLTSQAILVLGVQIGRLGAMTGQASL
jgi:hypothetical protein